MYLAQPQRPHPVPNPPPPLSMDRVTAPTAPYAAPASAGVIPPSTVYPAPSSAGRITPASSRSEGPRSTETSFGGLNWKLDVVQQPIRARMCGFGDKDRRPITPPPCVRLIVTDAQTGKEVDVTEIDMTFFVLTCDLWDEKGSQEVNLVKHSSQSPSISTATATSYPPPPSQQGPIHDPNWNPMMDTRITPEAQRAQQEYYARAYSYQRGEDPRSQQQSQTPYSSTNSIASTYRMSSIGQGYANPAYYQSSQPSSQYGYSHHSSPSAHTPTSHYSQGIPPLPSPTSGLHHSMPPPGMSPTMFTRNLIGSLSASAFCLTDPDNKKGIWFILQDLSVRTEGNFRLKMSFVNVGTHLPPTNNGLAYHNGTPTPTSPSSPPNTKSGTAAQPVLNQGSAPVLASVFSEPFQVFSAKKFPGVIESTVLSKCFALQGIKIPIRKDGKGSGSASGGRGSMSVGGAGDEDEGDEGEY